jgi:flagellar hook-basal body complex protein FliE
MRVDAVSQLHQGNLASAPKAVSNGDDFGQMMTDALREVNQSQQDARAIQNDLMAGRAVEMHELQIALERASVSLQLTMQVRNKLLEAYQEIQRMQI